MRTAAGSCFGAHGGVGRGSGQLQSSLPGAPWRPSCGLNTVSRCTTCHPTRGGRISGGAQAAGKAPSAGSLAELRQQASWPPAGPQCPARGLGGRWGAPGGGSGLWLTGEAGPHAAASPEVHPHGFAQERVVSHVRSSGVPVSREGARGSCGATVVPEGGEASRGSAGGWMCAVGAPGSRLGVRAGRPGLRGTFPVPRGPQARPAVLARGARVTATSPQSPGLVLPGSGSDTPGRLSGQHCPASLCFPPPQCRSQQRGADAPWCPGPPPSPQSSSGWGVGRLLPCPSPPSRHPPPPSWESLPAPAPPHPTCSRRFGRLACGPERPLLPAPSVSRLPLVLLELGPGPAPSLASLLPPGRTHRCLLGAAGRRSWWLVASVSSTKFHEPRATASRVFRPHLLTET